MSARRFLQDRRGLAAVELGLIAPVFFALLFGAFQGALMLWTQLGLQHATERAARCAAINATLCGSSSLVQSYAAAQGLSAQLPGSSFALANESCGSAVTGTTSVRFVTWTVALSARSCFPK